MILDLPKLKRQHLPFHVLGPLPARDFCIGLPAFHNRSKPAGANSDECSGLESVAETSALLRVVVPYIL